MLRKKSSQKNQKKYYHTTYSLLAEIFNEKEINFYKFLILLLYVVYVRAVALLCRSFDPWLAFLHVTVWDSVLHVCGAILRDFLGQKKPLIFSNLKFGSAKIFTSLPAFRPQYESGYPLLTRVNLVTAAQYGAQGTGGPVGGVCGGVFGGVC